MGKRDASFNSVSPQADGACWLSRTVIDVTFTLMALWENEMLLLIPFRLMAAGHLLLPFVAKVSKSTLLSVAEVRSGGKFFRFYFWAIFSYVPFYLFVMETTDIPTEKFTLLLLYPRVIVCGLLCLNYFR